MPCCILCSLPASQAVLKRFSAILVAENASKRPETRANYKEYNKAIR